MAFPAISDALIKGRYQHRFSISTKSSCSIRCIRAGGDKMKSWEEGNFQNQNKTLTIQAWKGAEEYDAIALPAGQIFDAASFYDQNPDVTYIEICDDTRCMGYYIKSDRPQLHVEALAS